MIYGKAYSLYPGNIRERRHKGIRHWKNRNGAVYPEIPVGSDPSLPGAELGGDLMAEPVRNTIILCGIAMPVLIRLAIDWIREAMRK